MRTFATIAFAITATSLAQAEPPNLRVPVMVPPAPTTLAMRPEDSAEPTRARASLAAQGQGSTVEQKLRQHRKSRKLDDELAELVTFRINVGFGLDGGAPSGRPLPSGQPLNPRGTYDALRSYGFGDVVLGTNGLVASSLTSYFAAQFRFNQSSALSYPIPSIYDGDKVREVIVRSGYGEAQSMFGHPLLKPIRLRAGRQFRYGPAIAHFDGLTVAYETDLFEVAAYAGRRVSNFGFDLDDRADNRGALAGASLRLSIAELIKAPLVVHAAVLTFDDHDHLDAKLAYQFNRKNSLLARARYLDSKLGRLSLLLRSRLSKVTTIAAELTGQNRSDLIYDLLLPRPVAGDSTDTRRYLSFGDPRPRTLFNLRAGTVLLRNIDLLLRGGFALEGKREDAPKSTFFASYSELGGAFEVRLRRSVRLGASILGRRYRREDSTAMATLRDGVPDELPPDTAGVGERNFVEGGVSVRYSTGARRFTATGEVYSRHYWVTTPYIPNYDRDGDNRSGGRFSVEGWAGSRIRIRAEYDVARLPETSAQELRRAQTLRVLTEGRF